MLRFLIITLVCLSLNYTASPQERPPPGSQIVDIQQLTQSVRGKPIPDPTNERVASSGILNADALPNSPAFQAHINRTPVYDRHDVFPPFEAVSFSYESAGADHDPDRPVMFFFNGGPGSSAIWLHMTAFGPEKVSVDLIEAVNTGFEYSAASNPGFLIDVGDLVFVDPVGTGLSRPMDDGDETAFKNLRVDARSMCRFAETWLAANDRQDAPVYLIGASYGSLRIAGMVSHRSCRSLQKQTRGLVFLSGLLDLSARAPSSVEKLIGMFPTNAALAWEMGRIDRSRWGEDLDVFLERAKTLTLQVVAPALFEDFTNASGLSNLRQASILVFLGMSDDLEIAARMRYLLGGVQNLIRANRRLCQYDGRFDCSNKGYYIPTIGLHEFALELERVLKAQLLKRMSYALDLESYAAFRRSSFTRNWSFRFDSSATSGTGTNMADVLWRKTEQLQKLQALLAPKIEPQPPLKIMVASGAYDLITPFFAMELALRTAGFSDDTLFIKTYAGGHMFYLDEKTGHQFATDIRSFVSAGD